MTDYTDEQIDAEIRKALSDPRSIMPKSDRAIARHFLALGRQDKGEPVAWLMTDVRTGLKRVTVQYSDHGMHDAITPLYAAPTTGDKT